MLILTSSSPRDCEMTFIVGRGFAELQILKKVKMALSFELNGILWWNFAYTLISTICSPRDCQISFGAGRSFAEVQVKKKWTWPYLLKRLVYFDKILHTHYYWKYLGRLFAKCHSSAHPRDCQMSFGIGRGFAEVQILKKKWNWSYLLNLLE